MCVCACDVCACDAPLPLSRSVSVSNVICALLFGERYDHDDAAFLSMRRCVSDAFAELDHNFELDFFPFLRFLPIYWGPLSEYSSISRKRDTQTTFGVSHRKV